MIRLADVGDECPDEFKTGPTRWKSLGDRNDWLLSLLYAELSKPKPKIGSCGLQAIEIDLLYAILQGLPPGACEGDFSQADLMRLMGLEPCSASTRRFTCSLKRLSGGGIIWLPQWIGNPLHIVVPYLMSDLGPDSPMRTSLSTLAYSFDVPWLKEALHNARLASRKLRRAIADPIKQAIPKEVPGQSQPPSPVECDDGTWKSDADIPEDERYQRYLASREWAVRKRAVKGRSSRFCERCHINPSVSVHHLTYARKYHEDLGDLQDICRQCHDFIHGKSDFDPLGAES